MSTKKTGSRSGRFASPPSIAGNACCVGRKEGEGPLADSFDIVCEDSFLGEKSWEKAESALVKKALALALDKASIAPAGVDFIFGGDLLNQCISSTFGLRETGIPYLGIYGACSTMAEGLLLASAMIDGGFASCTAAVTASHFCSAERQYRFPLEYGGQRPPSSQWTVTGAGAAVLTAEGPGPYITGFTCGKIVDPGIKDANNMGAAMAPAAYDTISTHFEDMSSKPSDYDLILTGDLGAVGSDILIDLLRQDRINIEPQHNDCGLMIFDRKAQDVHSGGSGCGCSASVLNGYILNGMRAGRWKKVLFAATGALLSPTSVQQGESIPGICCAVTISTDRQG